MGRLTHIIYILSIVAAASLAAGCNTSGCLENRSAIPLAGFYSSATGQSIMIDSLAVTGIGKEGDKPINDPGTPISSIYLPMRSTMQTTAWQFAAPVRYTMGEDEYNITICDTVTFDYDSAPYFASDECGVIYRYHITHMAYTRHLIDSIAITDSLISNTDIERIKIYYRTE